MKTHVIMEENYATLSTEYETLEEKESFLLSLNEAIKKCTLTPYIYIKPFSQTEPGKGKVVVEFSPNASRKIGDFFEFLIKENNLICD